MSLFANFSPGDFQFVVLVLYWLWFFVCISLIKAFTVIVGNSASACGSRLCFTPRGLHGHYVVIRTSEKTFTNLK